MTKAVLFLFALALISVFDIIKMKKLNLKREFIPYALFTAAAAAAGLVVFGSVFRAGILSAALKIIGVS